MKRWNVSSAGGCAGVVLMSSTVYLSVRERQSDHYTNYLGSAYSKRLKRRIGRFKPQHTATAIDALDGNEGFLGGGLLHAHAVCHV
jgi:hypothetical protein